MSVASALATGLEPSPRLAEAAVREAMEKAGLAQAGGVLLFLTAGFSRQAQESILAAARASGCLQVMGMTAPGLFTEAGWVLDQPAAAALVFGNGLGLLPAHGDSHVPKLSLGTGPSLPADWQAGPARFGLMENGSSLWQSGRLAEGRIDAAIQGARCRLAISTGLRCLGESQAVDGAEGHDLRRIGGLPALESLSRALPPEMRQRFPLPVHLLGACREDGDEPAIPILSANADGSLTLAERLHPSERIAWTLRQPLHAETDMANSLAGLESPAPAFGLMFSCIGRGPLFYGDDDRDLTAFRARFPGLPLLGAYGSSQIAPGSRGNRQWQNSVITALFETDHV